MAARSCIVIEGYIEPRKDEEAEGDSDSEENQEPEEDLQFLDLNDMINVSLGANSVNASSVVGRFVKIKDFRSGETYEVFGRFHLTSPWWTVTAKIHWRRKKWYLQGYPSYALTHLGQNGKSIISLFLTQCCVHSDCITEFCNYLSRFDNLQFSELFSILQQIADEEKDENKNGFANSIITYISSSVEGQNVQKAVKFQSLMKYLPQLLPRHFLRILKMDDNTLRSLDQMICTEVWKLGFSSILTKEVRLVGCEATLVAFEEASLLTTIPELQRHSLVIYDKLKQTCWDKGHTYVNVDDLTGLRPSEVMRSFSYAKYSKEISKVFDWMFSEVQVLIVDEGSLVSVKTLSTVLKSLMKYANLKKLIILGDIRQLPSIEPGNMFKDVYSSLYQNGWSIELSTNHRAESRLIVENAARIAEIGLKSTYKMLEYDAVWPISKEIGISIPAPDKKFILVSLDSGHSAVLQESINVLLRDAPGLDNHMTSQFIAFRRDDCALINELCCKKYSDHCTRDHKKKLDFRVGDKVCCTRNAYVEDFTKISEPESETDSKEMKEYYRLCNGEIFFITEDKIIQTNTSNTRYLLLDDKENKQILVNFEELRKKCKLMHAWARTIHTFQGSEAGTVVYVVGTAGRQNWQHIYTAVTRGRQRVYVVTSEAEFRKAMTARVPQRNSCLREWLQEKLVKPGAAPCSEGSQSQQQASCMLSAVAAPSSTLFDSSASSTQVLPNLSSCTAGEVNESTNKQSQKEDSYSEDLQFAQNYSWSPSSVELDNRECNGACERPDGAVNSLPHIGDTSTRESLVMTTESKTIEANWSPGCKRSDNTSAGEGSTAKYSKTLMESPLGCTQFGRMVLDNSSRVNTSKRLFTKENE